MSHVLAMDMDTSSQEGEYFDAYGRRIPPSGMEDEVLRDYQRHGVGQQSIFYPACFRVATDAFGGRIQMPPPAAFEDNCGQLQKELKRREDVATILNGPCYPWAMPQMCVEDHGEWIETMLWGVLQAYTAKFRYKSMERNVPKLQDDVVVVPESRLEGFFERLSRGPVFGLFFPNALPGYSLLAQRKQMKTLPDGFILSGPDALYAMVTHPAALLQGASASVYTLPAYQPKCGPLLARVDSQSVVIDAIHDTTYAHGAMAGGLSFVGF